MLHATEQVSSNKANDLVITLVSEKFFPSLDGLRGISIILVVLSHLNFSSNPLYSAIFNGILGVNIFFVISGFLITSLCLKERLQTGTISLKNFYIRRVLRILPVAYLYVAVIYILDCVFHLHIAYFQYLAALLFLLDFSYFRSHNFAIQFGHYWSLSIEEQFYLLFPFLLKKNDKLFFWSMIFIVGILPLFCLAQEFVHQLNQGAFYYFTHYLIKFQSIAVGCLLALLTFRDAFSAKWLRFYKMAGNLIAILLIFYLGYDGFYTIKTVFVNLVIAVLVAYIIISNIVSSNDLIYSFLNWKPISIIGKLSYSIYIWQQLFTFEDSSQPFSAKSLTVTLLCLIVVPAVSYFAYERYFLKLKTSFSKLKA